MSKPILWPNGSMPYPDESLAGFLNRWAHSHGMRSRTVLLNTLEISKSIRLGMPDIVKLAKALNLKTDVLSKIAPSDNPTVPVLRRSLTRTRSEAVCPHCLKDDSYSRQLWSHSLATACPIHGVRLLDKCQKCSGTVKLDRPRPHLCRCGADLRIQNTEVAPDEEVAFARLLLGWQGEVPVLPFDIGTGHPVEVDHFTLGFANHFCKSDTHLPGVRPGKSTIPSSVQQTVELLSPAFALMKSWPTCFDQRIQEMVEAPSDSEMTGLATRLGPWYNFLFKQYTQPAYKPFRVVAADRIMLSHDGTLNARTSNIQSIATVAKNWYSIAEAERELGVSAERLNDGIDRDLIEARIYDASAGYRQRFIARDEIDRLKALQEEHIDDLAAIKILNVPKSIYDLMREAGWFEYSDPTSLAPVTIGNLRHLPLLRLIKRLKQSSQTDYLRIGGVVIKLRDLNLRRTTDHQRLVSLYRAIAAGELTPIADTIPDGVGGLMFSQREVDKRIASWFVARGLTLQQISALTNSHYDAVKSWVDDGLLPATREPLEQGSPWVVDLQDLVNFLMTFTPLAWQASVTQSSSRGLTGRLQKIGVSPTEPSSGRGALVKLADLFSCLGNSSSES